MDSNFKQRGRPLLPPRPSNRVLQKISALSQHMVLETQLQSSKSCSCDFVGSQSFAPAEHRRYHDTSFQAHKAYSLSYKVVVFVASSGCSQELGLGAPGSAVEIVDITPEQLKTDSMLTGLNPQRRLPFFYDPADDLCLNESGGLVQYLLEKYDLQNALHPKLGDPTRPEFLKLVHFGPGTAYHVGVPILFKSMPPKGVEPTPESVVKEKKSMWHQIVVPTLEQALDKYGGPYLLGSKLSAADLVCGYDVMTISFSDCANELLDPRPQVKAYLELLRKGNNFKELYDP